MAQITYPCFNRGRILKISMLEDLRDFPRDMLDCFTESLSDGIVSGLTPIVEKDHITFSKGVIKHNGAVYLVRDLSAIQYGETNTDVAIKIAFREESQEKDYKAQTFDFLIDHNMTIAENEIELGRFRLKAGAYLRSDYQSLEDMTTLYNTINVVHVKYAGYERPTISHLLLKYFAKEALACNPPSHWDVSFALLCLNSLRIEKEVIVQYLRNRLNNDDLQDTMNNTEMHRHLVKSLELIKREGSPRKRRMEQQAKVMLD